jgi:3-phenylpropionate/trans-cinnamate dioxygenase ferredoxin subunit
MAPAGVRRHWVGERAELPLNRFKIMDLDGRSVGVVRTRLGIFAIRNSCPHQSAPICLGRVTGTNLPSRPGEYRYGLRDELVRCPWHGFEFRLDDGTSAFDVTRKRLVTYPVIIDGEDVFIELKARGSDAG